MPSTNLKLSDVIAGLLSIVIFGASASISAQDGLALTYDVPAGWHHQRIGDSAQMTASGIGLRFVRLAVEEREALTTQESVELQLREMSAQYVAGSVEKEANLTPITGRVGSYAVFTDASLVGMAEAPGNFKTATQGLLSEGNSIVVFTIFSNAIDTIRYTEALTLATELRIAAMTDGPKIVRVPEADWAMTFDAPRFESEESGLAEEGFQYSAASPEGFNLSIFVEDAENSTGHGACADYYWARAKENPMVDGDSVRWIKGEKVHTVTYRLRGQEKGVEFDVPNINLYFAHEGAWVGVHISKFPFEEGDQDALDRFVESFEYATSLKRTDPK